MKILVAGCQRSGTTWTSSVLGCAENTRVVLEPDNLLSDLAAATTVRELGHMPVLAERDQAPDAYARLWQFAFAGGWPWDRWRIAFVVGRRIRRFPAPVRNPLVTGLMRATSRLRSRPQHVIAKSVSACFSVEWVAAHFSPKVVITVRNPMAMVSSWRDIGIETPYLATNRFVRERFIDQYDLPEPPPPTADPLVQLAWSVGIQSFALKLACDRHPDWRVVQHEVMCSDPKAAFRELYRDLGLAWTVLADQYLEKSNQPGEGHTQKRVAHDAPHRWRSRLDRHESLAVQRVLSEFPVALEAV
jgi:hypothetical protein